MTPAMRFWSKVDRSGGSDSCWLWLAAQKPGGYGAFWFDNVCVRAHRFAYTLLIGPIPTGLTLDHLCRNRLCVNPAHLEPVTDRVNVRRSPYTRASINAAKTHCPIGHAYTATNTYLDRDGGRRCRACVLDRSRRRYQLRKAAA